MTNDKDPIYKIIRTKCRRRFWTSKEFAQRFGSVKLTSRCRELENLGHEFKTKVISINGRQYKGYQYIGKKAA